MQVNAPVVSMRSPNMSLSSVVYVIHVDFCLQVKCLAGF